MVYEHDIGEERIVEVVRYIAAEANDLNDGKKIYLYTPDKDKARVSDDVISWMLYLGGNAYRSKIIRTVDDSER